MHFRILIAGSDPNSMGQTARRMQNLGCKIVGSTSDGANVVALAEELRPNVLIMEPLLPGLNCDEITADLEREYLFPLVKIVISNYSLDLVAAHFYENGGDLFLVNPINHERILTRMEMFLNIRKRDLKTPSPATRIRNLVKQELLYIEVPMTINGFYYLLDGITLTVQNPQLLRNIVGDLYPAIAGIQKCPVLNVERCIRTAIEQTFERSDLRVLTAIFGSYVRKKTGKPTNGDFIAVITETVRRKIGLI